MKIVVLVKEVPDTYVFLAAPLAATTDIRMPGIWPNATTLSRAYPIE
jgi:hypothetical protein